MIEKIGLGSVLAVGLAPKTNFNKNIALACIPIGSMYGIFAYMLLILMVNAGKYTIITWIPPVICIELVIIMTAALKIPSRVSSVMKWRYFSVMRQS